MVIWRTVVRMEVNGLSCLFLRLWSLLDGSLLRVLSKHDKCGTVMHRILGPLPLLCIFHIYVVTPQNYDSRSSRSPLRNMSIYLQCMTYFGVYLL